MRDEHERWVKGLRDGDGAVFDEIHARHAGRLYGFLRRMTGRADVADDLLQDTFLSLARAAPTLRDDTDVGAYLFTIARNAYRSHRRWSLLDVARWFAAPHPDTTDPRYEERMDATAATRRLERELAALADDQREAVLLVCVEGMSCDDAAAIAGVPAATLRKRLSRA
ncbi:MAG: RNA polymerase sigma factor, partial [Polyangiaceae bacterium]|nr:RNA polymerase sigma factor [Polyangiaceae bacterium]